MKLAWPAVLNSLFVKVYLTLLASLAAVAIASAIFVRLGQEEQDMSWHSRRDELVAAMLPAGEDPASLKPTLDRLTRSLPTLLCMTPAAC